MMEKTFAFYVFLSAKKLQMADTYFLVSFYLLFGKF